MRYFKQSDFTDQEGRIWFHADKFEIITASMDCTFEHLTLDVVGSTGSISDIDCTFDSFDAELSGHFGEIGDIEVSLEPLDCIATGVNFEPSIGSIDCTMLPWFLVMGKGQGIECEFEPFGFAAYSAYRSDDMDLIFKEFDMWATGESTFQSLQVELEPMDAVMYSGSLLEGEMEKPDLVMTGIAGVNGVIDCVMLRPQASMLGGPPPYIVASLEAMQIGMEGRSDNVCSLDLTMKYPVIGMVGDSGLVGALSVAMKPLAIQMVMSKFHPTGSMTGTILPLHCEMGSIESIGASITAQISKIKCEMQAHYDGLNDIDLELRPPEIQMSSDVGEEGSCDLADTLIFDEEY